MSKATIIVSDSLSEMMQKFRNTPNAITGEKPLFRDLTDTLIWDSAFDAGVRTGNKDLRCCGNCKKCWCFKNYKKARFHDWLCDEWTSDGFTAEERMR